MTWLYDECVLDPVFAPVLSIRVLVYTDRIQDTDHLLMLMLDLESVQVVFRNMLTVKQINL
jgi:hypothetical protein